MSWTIYLTLTYLKPVFPIYPFWNHNTTSDFLLSVGVKKEPWLGMGERLSFINILSLIFFVKLFKYLNKHIECIENFLANFSHIESNMISPVASQCHCSIKPLLSPENM